MESSSATEWVALAEAVGSRPYVFLTVLVAAATFAVLLLVLVVRWSDAHARAIWGKAKKGWSALAGRPTMRALETRFPWIWRVMRSLSATEYLVLHLALGLAVVVGGLFFVMLAQSVTQGHTMVATDMALANALHRSASPQGIAALGFFSSLGGGVASPIIGVCVALVLALRKKRLLLVGWVVALAGAGLLNTALKAAFARARPVFDEPYSAAGFWSFPSGHTMVTFVVAGMLAYLGLLFVRSSATRLLLVLLALAWAVAMGFSRMYLGVHYLSDVMAGFAAGTVWLAACLSGLEIARRRPNGVAAVPAQAGSENP